MDSELSRCMALKARLKRASLQMLCTTMGTHFRHLICRTEIAGIILPSCASARARAEKQRASNYPTITSSPRCLVYGPPSLPTGLPVSAVYSSLLYVIYTVRPATHYNISALTEAGLVTVALMGT